MYRPVQNLNGIQVDVDYVTAIQLCNTKGGSVEESFCQHYRPDPLGLQ